MKRTLLFTLILLSQLFPQLKELDVKPTENRGGIPIFRDYPDKAGIIFYTQFDDLKFYSSYGIVDVKGDPAGGKYVVIIEAVPRQTIEVRAPGFKTEMIRLESLQPRDVFYYEVLPKKVEGISGVSEISITVQTTPPDASVFLDGNPFPNNFSTKVPVGIHKLKIEKPGYKTEERDISVTPDQTLFKIDLEKVQLSPVTIRSTPANATVYINNEKKGTTELGVFLFPGSYDLRLDLADHVPVAEKLNVIPSADKSKNVFTYTLVRDKGELQISVTPANAGITLNKKPLIAGKHELNPGKYTLEVTADRHDPYLEEIEILRGQTVTKNVNLVKNTGILVLSVMPSEAKIILDKTLLTPGTHELNPGKYTLEITSDRHDPYFEEIEILRGQTVTRNVDLVKNTGVLVLEVNPPDANISINKEKRTGKTFEMAPGIYEVEVSSPTYYIETEIVQIEKGKSVTKKVTLRQKTGTLQFTIKPLEAKVTLSQNGVQKYNWEGMNLLNDLPEGTYDLTAKAQGYKSYTGKVTVSENQMTVEDIQMTPGSDTPEGMVLVEGGTFTMGCTSEQSDCDGDERPTHQVTVSSFMIGKYEVTQALWESVMGSNPSNFKGSNRPVEQVSWYDAVEFCNKLSEKEGLQKAYTGSGSSIRCDFTANGYRLPTEAEWEYAARGGNRSKGSKYSGSNDLKAVGWYWDNSGSETKEVGNKQANELGIYDMSGNVWEWCWDRKGEYSSSNQTDPRGPNSGSNRVLRGGSWGSLAEYCRVAGRSYVDPGGRSSSYGFRLARTR